MNEFGSIITPIPEKRMGEMKKPRHGSERNSAATAVVTAFFRVIRATPATCPVRATVCGNDGGHGG